MYGERGKEDHAVIAMISRAFIRQDSFVVCGTGEQIHYWTYVSDILEGNILAAEKIDDEIAVNQEHWNGRARLTPCTRYFGTPGTTLVLNCILRCLKVLLIG
jgi:nucleoside-diphosphate-sugar epimerase